MASCFVNRYASFFSATGVGQVNSSLPTVNNYLCQGGDMNGTGILFLGDIFLGQCTQKTKNKLIMTALERRNFKKMV